MSSSPSLESNKSSSARAESSSLLEKDNGLGDRSSSESMEVQGYPPQKKSVFSSPCFSWSVAGFAVALLVLFIALFAAQTPAARLGTCPDNDHPSVVLFIGDGFGPQMTSLVRLFFNPEVKGDEPFTAINDPKSQCQISFTQTRSASAFVTDSAASGTALSTGSKTTNGFLGVLLDPRDPEHSEDPVPIGNVLEAAKLQGYATGVVVTSAVTHATPAAFTAHVVSRESTKLIALQQATMQNGTVDLYIGGGRIDYEKESRDDHRDLVDEMRQNGYNIAYTKEELMNVSSLPLLSLLGSNHLGYKIDRNNSEEVAALPSLVECVRKAIELFRKSGKPFFLMVEGSKIDMASHSNDLASAVYEAKDFLDALDGTIKYANNMGDMIVLSTSDHDTGGLSIIKPVNMDLLHSVTASSEFMVSIINASGNDTQVIRDTIKRYTTIDNLSDEEIDHIKNASNQINALSEVVSAHINVTWGAHDHTGTNVLLYSCFGGWKRSEACKYKQGLMSWFPVFNDNTDIPKFIANRSHTSLSDATTRAVEVFSGHITDDSDTVRRSTDDAGDIIDRHYHSMDNV